MARTRIIGPKIREQTLAGLFEGLARLKTPNEAREFINLLLTPTEKERFGKRLQILKELRQAKPYKEIKEALGVTDNTIAGMSNVLKESPGGNLKILDELIRGDLLKGDQSLRFYARRGK